MKKFAQLFSAILLLTFLNACSGGTTTTAASTVSLSTVGISSLSPTSGVVAGGTTVFIYGTNFAAGAIVYFGGVTATAVTYISSTELEAVTPAGTGTVSVEIVSGGYTSTLSSAYTFGSTGQPTVTSISPTTAPQSGGTYVTIYGTNFSSGLSVTIGSVSCTNVLVTSTSQISCYTGAESAIASGLSVVVANSSGLSGILSGVFSYTAASSTAPVISSLSPSTGPITGGTTVYLYGINFTTASSVSIGGTACYNVTYLTTNELSCVTGAVSAAETASVIVTNSSGYSAILANAFTYGTSAVVLSSVVPATGSINGGTEVFIFGSGFSNGMAAYFGGVPCTALTVLSATELSCYSPAGTGSVNLQLVSAQGPSNILGAAYLYSASASTAPTLTFNANGGGSQILYSDQAVTLNWTSTNATYCEVDWANRQALLAAGTSGSAGVPALDYVNDDTYWAGCTNGTSTVPLVSQTISIQRVFYAVGAAGHAAYRLKNASDAAVCAKKISAKKACVNNVQIGRTRDGINQNGVVFDTAADCKCGGGSSYVWY